MFRVCGVTYTFSTNYGTCLQAYALQTVIEKMNVCGERPSYLLTPLRKCPGYPKAPEKGIKEFIKARIRTYSRKQFVGFEKKYMKYAPVYPIAELSKLNDQADVFVCGSDVVWNPYFNRGLESYYLDFAKKYSFSYAASFGQSDIKPEQFARIGELVSRLDAVSVREKGSADIAKQCTDKPVEITVDPVLLLSQEDWNRVAEKDNRDGRFVFVYSVTHTGILKGFAEKLSRQAGIGKVIYSGGNAGAVARGGISKVFPPQRWLQLIRDAEYVVTDSFHGTAFAALFHKKVFTIVKGDPAAGFNVRMYDFLKALEMEDRIFTSIPDEIDLGEPDYQKADALLKARVDRSMAFLQTNLEAAYRRKQQTEAKR